MNRIRPSALLTVAALLCLPGSAQQTAVSPAGTQTPTLKSAVDEVVLDIVVRDKKGKPVTDLKPEDVIVFDNGARQRVSGFRLVRGAEAITQGETVTKLDPLRQVRLVTLAFEALAGADQRKMARTAAIDLIKGEQGTNVFYAVVVVNTRLLLLQQFTNDKAALTNAIERATTGLAIGKLASESEAIKDQLKRNLNGQNGADQSQNLLAAATQTATQPVSSGSEAIDAKLASIMLDMLRMDAAISSRNARMSIEALKSLVQGQQSMPGRKSILYFTAGMYVTSELDVMFNNLVGMANRANVTFYAVDSRGVMTVSQTSEAASQLNAAAAASAVTVNRTGGAISKAEIMSSDDAEGSARSNIQLRLRELAESTGGFLIGDSNDLRVPLRHVNEEISSYYELTFNPGIQTYDGSFRTLSVNAERKGLVIHARNGYFALPPEARALGLQAFELPLLKAISDGKLSTDVDFRAGAVLLQQRPEGTDVTVLVEVPLRGLQPRTDPAKKTLGVHFSLGALVKNAKGDVVEKLTRDRSLQVTPDQLKLGNFVDKMTVTVPAGAYTLESAVMDWEGGKIGTGRSAFTIESKAKGVGISSLTTVRSYAAGAKGLDPADPFQFQGGSITPTLNTSVQRSQDAALRLFFIVYPDSSIAAKPTVDIEFIQNGRALTKVPMPLPAVDAQGKIPYVMTISAAAIPPGSYEVRATARQGETVSESRIAVRIDKI